MVKVDRVSLGEKGLNKFFSPLESRIIDLLWARGRMGSAEIHKEMEDISLPCVAGTLDRLVKSGIVKREVVSKGKRLRYIYQAIMTREQLGEQISERLIETLVETFGASVYDTVEKVRQKKEGRL